jgi:transcriptional regulator with XRE-family HTH domain
MPKGKDFSKVLCTAMRKQNLSQFEVAEMMGVAQQTVSNWKLGTRKPRPIHKRKLLQMAGLGAAPAPKGQETGEAEETIGLIRTRLAEDIEGFANVAEESIRSLRKLEMVVECLPCAVWSGVFGRGYFCPTLANRRFAEYAGCSDYDAETWEQNIVSDEHRKAYRAFHRQSVLAEHESVRLDYTIVPASGGGPVRVREIRNVANEEIGGLNVFAIIVPVGDVPGEALSPQGGGAKC